MALTQLTHYILEALYWSGQRFALDPPETHMASSIDFIPLLYQDEWKFDSPGPMQHLLRASGENEQYCRVLHTLLSYASRGAEEATFKKLKKFIFQQVMASPRELLRQKLQG